MICPYTLVLDPQNQVFKFPEIVSRPSSLGPSKSFGASATNFVKRKHQHVARRKVSVDNSFRGEVLHRLHSLLHYDHAVCERDFVASATKFTATDRYLFPVDIHVFLLPVCVEQGSPATNSKITGVFRRKVNPSSRNQSHRLSRPVQPTWCQWA